MATTSVQYNGTGAQVDFTITYAYTAQDAIEVYVDSVLQTRVTHYDFLNATTIRFGTAPPSGTLNVELRRNTDTTPIVDWTAGASIQDTDLDSAFLQNLHLIEELENNSIAGMTKDGANWDAESVRITNVSPPVADTDAATKASIASQVTAAEVAQTAAEAAETAALVSANAAAASESAASASEIAAAASEAVVTAGTFYTASGTASFFSLTEINTGQPTTFGDGEIARFTPLGTSAGSVFVNVNTFGSLELTDAQGNSLVAGELRAEVEARIRYDVGTLKWILENPVTAGETLLSKDTLSSDASLEVALGTVYDEFILRIRQYVPGTDNTNLRMRVSDDDAVTFENGASAYSIQREQQEVGGNASQENNGVSNMILVQGCGSTASEYVDVDLRIVPGDGTYPFRMFGVMQGELANGDAMRGQVAGINNVNSTRSTHIELTSSSGNLGSGTVQLWGVFV